MTGRGNVVLLAVLLGVVAATPAGVLAAGAVTIAVSTRWGVGGLDALTGAQAVLGPAVAVGPPPAALSAALAGVAVLLLVPRQRTVEVSRVVAALAAGAAAAIVMVGPGDRPVIRGVATLAGTAAAFALARLPGSRRQLLATGAAAAAVVLAAV